MYGYIKFLKTIIRANLCNTKICPCIYLKSQLVYPDVYQRWRVNVKEEGRRKKEEGFYVCQKLVLLPNYERQRTLASTERQLLQRGEPPQRSVLMNGGACIL